MNILSFSNWMSYILEMAYISGRTTYSSHSREHDWETFYKKDATFITNLPSKYKMYKHGSHYFLTTEDDKYLGYIQLSEVTNNYKTVLADFKITNIHQIGSSNQTGIVKGFYNIMFTSLFTHTNINCIMSDDNLSTNAIDSYSRLSKGTNLSIYSYNQVRKEVTEYNKQIIIDDPSSIIIILPKDKKLLEEIFKKYIQKITTNESYIIEYNNNDINYTLYLMLFTSYGGQTPIDEWC